MATATRTREKLEVISVDRAATLGRLLYFASKVSPWRLEQIVSAAEAWYIHDQMEDSSVPMKNGRFEWGHRQRKEVELWARIITDMDEQDGAA